MMKVSVTGLPRLQRRLEARGLTEAVHRSLRREADAIAADAARAAPGALGQTVDVIDESRGEQIAYAIGTAHRAGPFVEYGTIRRPATPWLGPAFRAHLRGIKHSLRNILRAHTIGRHDSI